MTLELIEPMPDETDAERTHVMLFESSETAKQIAASAIRVAHSDCVAAVNQIRNGTTDEALQIIAEAREQLEFAQNALSGRLWTLRV